jgi:hypothetical protein
VRVKTHALVKGIPAAKVDVKRGEDGQAGTINMVVDALDHFSRPTTVASLRLTPDEAITMAERLMAKAQEIKNAP